MNYKLQIKIIVLSIITMSFLTACGGSDLPDPDMNMPVEPPNSELMQPTSNPV